VAWLPTLIAPLFAQGRAAPPGEPTLAGGLAQYDVYPTADGRWITLGALEPKFLSNFFEAVGRPELAAIRDRERLRVELRAIFESRTRAEWVACLREVDTCFAPVNTLEETLEDPHVRETGMFTSVEHPRLGRLPQISPPFAFSETPATIRRPPPELGEHTSELLGELGLSAEHVIDLADRGVV
jgi:crotonobetainyl-CoA:carnitine CoA-transferase CaiB-like acyl-CoA transferase